LILPTKIFPKDEITKNLQLILRVIASSDMKHSQQLENCQGVLTFTAGLPAET